MLFLFPVLMSAQEVLMSVGGYPALEEYHEKKASTVSYKDAFLIIPSIELPFYDDFSSSYLYPDTALWLDDEAYINSEFGLYPVNLGVATMDAIDARGRVYLEATPFTFLADHLTSKPIRLDSIFDPEAGQIIELTPADSVYFSFYYQPQGRGDIPLDHDSLVLQFGSYNQDTVFSHFDSINVFGFDYQEFMLAIGEDFLPPGFAILPYDFCDSIPYLLEDTLFLEDTLLIPCDSVFTLDTDWTSIWFAEGDTLTDFLDTVKTYFKKVVIPITDTVWFRSDFQFRFINYASISNIGSAQSNTDHWNIDVVRLDANRTMDDMYVREVRFSEVPPGLIVDYSTMPYGQYAGDVTRYKKDSFPVYVNNNDSIDHSYVYNYYVLNQNGDTLEPFLIDDITQPLLPRETIEPIDYMPFTEPPVTYFYTSPSEDTADFWIHHTVYDQEIPDIADTVVYHQRFRNYFAYDDGSAEAGYGLSPAGAQLAVQFRTEIPDTLRGVQIYFNKTFNQNNNRLFDFAVWGDNEGKPGNIIYLDENVRPEFPDGLNRFYNHLFDEYVKLGVQVFYVGWIQSTNHLLNVGFDRNVNSLTKNFFNASGEWIQSSFEGSIMIRPLVGKALDDAQEEYKTTTTEIEVYPNPSGTSSYITIQLPESEMDPQNRPYQTLRIIDVSGRLVYEGPYVSSFPVQAMERGFYIVHITNNLLSTKYTAKMLIAR